MSLQKETTILNEFAELKEYTLQQCKDSVKQLLSSYEEGVLLWIVQHFYHSLYMKKLIPCHINPVNILYTRNIVKKIPPGSYSKVVMMISYQSEKGEANRDELILNTFYTAYELLRSSEY